MKELYKEFYNELKSILSNSDYFNDVEFVKADDFKYLINSLKSKINDLSQYSEQVKNKILAMNDEECADFIFRLEHRLFFMYFGDISRDLNYYLNRNNKEYFIKSLPKYRKEVNEYLISKFRPNNEICYEDNEIIVRFLLNIDFED